MAGLLIILISLIIGGYFFQKEFDTNDYPDITKTIYTALGLSLFGVVYEIFLLPFSDFIYHFSIVSGITSLLIALLMFVRRLKPKFFRYPYYVVFIPAFLPISFLLIYDIEVLRSVIVLCLTAVTLLVCVILINSYSENGNMGNYAAILMGIITLSVLNRSLFIFPFEIPILERLLIAIGGLGMLHLFLKTFKNINLNHNYLL